MEVFISKSSKRKVLPVKVSLAREIEATELICGQYEYKGLSLKLILISPKTKDYLYVEAPSAAYVLRAAEDIKLVEKVVETPFLPSR